MDPSSYILGANSQLSFINANINFEQNTKYIKAIHKLHKDYVKQQKESSKRSIVTPSIENLSSNDLKNFNSIKKAIQAMSQRQNIEESIENAPTDDDLTRSILLKKIEQITEQFTKDIEEGKQPKFVLRNQKMWSNCVFNERVSLKNPSESKMITVNFGAKNSREKFILILHLLSCIHEMLTKRTTCTKRELYYQNISMIKSQTNVDTAVRDICCLLNAPPWELGLLTTSKGLIAGPLKIITKEGHSIDCMNAGGILIPQDVRGIKSISSNAKFILVIEKDASFQKLLDEGALERLRPCILITGKGYPDVNTRLMLKFLVDKLNIPSFALVDADPHGIEIMCTYRFGSLAMSHLSNVLAVPSLRWLGVYPSDITNLGIPSLELSTRGVSKCNELLGRPYCLEGSMLRQQIEIILQNKVKAEIEAVGTMSQAYLTDRYIPHKMCANDFI